MRTKIITISFVLLALCACANQAASDGRPATISLKDGTTVAGTVTKSDTASVTIKTSNGVVSTYPVSQVASINYAPAAPAAAPATTPADTTAATAATAASSPASPAAAQPAPPPASSPAPSPAASAAQPEPPPPATEPPPAQEYQPALTFQTVPAGATIAVRTNQTINSQTAAPGQTYSGVIARNVLDANGKIAIPRGSTATLIIRSAQQQGKVKGQSLLDVDVAAVQVDGRRYRLETRDYVEKGRQGVGANKRTGEFAGGGGLLGTIVGAVAGGGKGAAIGALSGAAAGATTQTLTRGGAVKIPAETVLNFLLEAPIRIREMH